MPLYRFHIIDNGRTMPDEDGTELPDDRSALKEAWATAEDMVRDGAIDGVDVSRQKIQVWDGLRLVVEVHLSFAHARMTRGM